MVFSSWWISGRRENERRFGGEHRTAAYDGIGHWTEYKRALVFIFTYTLDIKDEFVRIQRAFLFLRGSLTNCSQIDDYANIGGISMKCNNCGRENDGAAYSCFYCGAPCQHVDHDMRRNAEKAATASLVCGIVGFFCCGMILGIIAIVQGRKAQSLGYTGGMATAGIVLGIIGLVVWVFGTILRLMGLLFV